VGFLTHLNGKKTDEIIDDLRGEANDFGRWYEDTASPDLCGEIQSSITLFFTFLRDIQSLNP
jgi:hypothetical protein